MFKSHIKACVGLAVLTMAAGAAHAEGLYVGGALAEPDYRSSIEGYGGGGGGHGPGLKLYGGYELTPNLAIESGYFNLGRSKNDGGDVRAQGLYVDGVGSYEFLPSWSVLGSVGVAEGWLKVPSASDRSPALKLGLGVQYALNSTTALRLGYDRYHFTSAFGGNANVGQTVFGVKVAF